MNGPTCSYRRAATCFIALGLAATAGCGPRTGEVTGQVTYGNKTVSSGSVMIVASDSLAYHGVIDDDGNYTIANVPTGPGKMAVFSPGPDAYNNVFPQILGKEKTESPKPPPFRDDPKKWFPIPEKYQEFEGSGLTVAVKSGQTRRDLALVD